MGDEKVKDGSVSDVPSTSAPVPAPAAGHPAIPASAQTMPNVDAATADALQKEMSALVGECVRLSVKMAVTDCPDKEKCPVYRCARRIAQKIDVIQELSEKV